MRYIDPWTTPGHRRWVALGNCPSIHSSKAWCRQSAGHVGKHTAPLLTPDGRVINGLSWTAADQHPKAKP
jgi:hypothetical protein